MATKSTLEHSKTTLSTFASTFKTRKEEVAIGLAPHGGTVTPKPIRHRVCPLRSRHHHRPQAHRRELIARTAKWVPL